MNVSATNNSLQRFNNSIKPGGSAPSFEKEHKSWLPVPVKDTVTEGKYKYYVQEDTSETVYTEKKNLQKMRQSRGGMINIFA